MKSFVFCVFLFIFCISTYGGEKEFSYTCTDPDQMRADIQLSVFVDDGMITYLINDTDQATIDPTYKPNSNYYKKWNRLLGHFESLGDGGPGYDVDILVNRYLYVDRLIENARFGFIEYRAQGPDSYFSSQFRCDKNR